LCQHATKEALMEVKRTLEDLISKVLSELRRFEYSRTYVAKAQGFYRTLKKFAENQGKLYFSESLVVGFLINIPN